MPNTLFTRSATSMMALTLATPLCSTVCVELRFSCACAKGESEGEGGGVEPAIRCALIKITMSSKAAKEFFVSGHSGTSVGEVATVLASIAAGHLVRNVLFVCAPRVARVTRYHLP